MSEFRLTWLIRVVWFVATTILVMTCCIRSEVLLFNATESMPRGLWLSMSQLTDGHSELFRSGDVVALNAPQMSLELGCVRSGQLLIKRVLAAAPQSVCEHEGSWFAHEPFDGSNRSVGLVEARLELDQKCRQLPDQTVFLLGQHPRSCDSRVFGPVHVGFVRTRVRPLFVVDELVEVEAMGMMLERATGGRNADAHAR